MKYRVRAPGVEHVIEEGYDYSGIEVANDQNAEVSVNFISTFEELEEHVGGEDGMTRCLNLFVPYTNLGDNNLFEDDGTNWVEGFVIHGRKHRVLLVELVDVTREQARMLRRWALQSAESIRQRSSKRYISPLTALGEARAAKVVRAGDAA